MMDRRQELFELWRLRRNVCDVTAFFWRGQVENAVFNALAKKHGGFAA